MPWEKVAKAERGSEPNRRFVLQESSLDAGVNDYT